MSQTQSAASRVFETPQLLSTILCYYYDHYVINHGYDGSAGTSTQKSVQELELRRVNKLWLSVASTHAFRFCNAETFGFLKKVRDGGGNDYGPFVVHADLSQAFEYEYLFLTKMSSGASLTLENLTTLTLDATGHDVEFYLDQIFGMCSKLASVVFTSIYVPSVAGWLVPLIQIAPNAEYHITVDLLPRENYGRLFQELEDCDDVKIMLYCNYRSFYLPEHVDMLSDVCDFLHMHPGVMKIVKQFTFSITEKLLTETLRDVVFLFALVSHGLEEVHLRITDITRYTDSQFVEQYVSPVIRVCSNAQLIRLYLEKDYQGKAVGPWDHETDERWQTHLKQAANQRVPTQKTLVYSDAIKRKSPSTCVFETPELLTKILGYYYDLYVIDFNDGGYAGLSTRKFLRELGLRRVNKLWLNEASRQAFKHCNIETITYLKKLCNDGLTDYGPMVRDASLGQIYRFNHFWCSLMAKDAPLNLENLKTLELCSGGDPAGISKVFGMCTKLETVSVSGALEDATEWVYPLLQIAPRAEYHIHAVIYEDQEFGDILQLITDYQKLKFMLHFHYRFEHAIPDPDWLRPSCEAFTKYPAAAGAITQFGFQATAELLIQGPADVFLLFELISPNLKDVEIRIIDIDGGKRDFVALYLVPTLKKCRNARKMDIYLENNSRDDTVRAQMQEIEDERRKQIEQCTPGLESLVFKARNKKIIRRRRIVQPQ